MQKARLRPITIIMTHFSGLECDTYLRHCHSLGIQGQQYKGTGERYSKVWIACSFWSSITYQTEFFLTSHVSITCNKHIFLHIALCLPISNALLNIKLWMHYRKQPRERLARCYSTILRSHHPHHPPAPPSQPTHHQHVSSVRIPLKTSIRIFTTCPNPTISSSQTQNT